MGGWMRDGLEIADDDVLRAIADQAKRMNKSIRSIAVFDGTVRAVLLRSAGRVLAMCATARVEAGWRATEPAR